MIYRQGLNNTNLCCAALIENESTDLYNTRPTVNLKFGSCPNAYLQNFDATTVPQWLKGQQAKRVSL